MALKTIQKIIIKEFYITGSTTLITSYILDYFYKQTLE